MDFGDVKEVKEMKIDSLGKEMMSYPKLSLQVWEERRLNSQSGKNILGG